jgi:hypothetical protein
MKKFIVIVIAAFALLISGMIVSVVNAYGPYVYGNRVGDHVTFTNDTDVAAESIINDGGFQYFRAPKLYTPAFSFPAYGQMTCSADGGVGFWYGDHNTYTRAVVRWGRGGYSAQYRYIYDGKNIGVIVPPHSSVTVTCR